MPQPPGPLLPRLDTIAGFGLYHLRKVRNRILHRSARRSEERLVSSSSGAATMLRCHGDECSAKAVLLLSLGAGYPCFDDVDGEHGGDRHAAREPAGEQVLLPVEGYRDRQLRLRRWTGPVSSEAGCVP